MMMYARALQIGQVGPVTAVHWTAEVVAPSAVALLLLGDTVRAGWELPAAVAGLVTLGAAVLLATAPATSATHEPQALPAAPDRPALPAAPAAQPAQRPSGERVIWWGPPPIWIPRSRTPAALATPPVRALTWSPAVDQTFWTPPQRPDADRDEVPAPALAEPRRPLSPWHDLNEPSPGRTLSS
jgi:hypothetical protein